MGHALSKLLSIASPAEVSAMPSCDSLPSSLAALLGARNGFIAFYSALHVRHAAPHVPGESSLDVQSWSELDIWRSHYPSAGGLVLFAEDLFANQFGISNDDERVFRVEIETGEIAEYAPTIEGWAERILADHRFETAWPLAQEWQRVNDHALLPGERLVPHTPFVLRGEYEVANFRVMNELEAMRRYGLLVRAIEGRPDGVTVTIEGF